MKELTEEQRKLNSIAQSKKIREERRTNVDFSKHELTIIKDDHVLIHDFKIPGTVTHRVKFINTSGILAVTGDYGNWMFCREFHPSEEGYADAYYWGEKLRISSTQQSSEFCEEMTRELLNDAINGGLVEQGYEDERLEKMLEYYNGCLNHVSEGQFWYECWASDNLPNFTCGEDVIVGKKVPFWLEVVYDAFNRMCDIITAEKYPEL